MGEYSFFIPYLNHLNFMEILRIEETTIPEIITASTKPFFRFLLVPCSSSLAASSASLSSTSAPTSWRKIQNRRRTQLCDILKDFYSNVTPINLIIFNRSYVKSAFLQISTQTPKTPNFRDLVPKQTFLPFGYLFTFWSLLFFLGPYFQYFG